MKAFVIALGVLCALMLVDFCQAHDDHGKSDRHMEELEEMLKNSMLPEFEDLPRFRRSADEGSDQQQQGGGGKGRGKGPKGGSGGPGGRGGQGGQGQGQSQGQEGQNGQ